MFLYPWILALGAFSALAGAFTASAQENDSTPLTIAEQAFYHVDVTGVPAGAPVGASLAPLDGLPREQRWGKAFAIAPDVLLTAQHVLGDLSEWAPRNTASEVARAARPVNRTVALNSKTTEQPVDDVVVYPTPTIAIDAATLTALGRQIKEFFSISLCPIDEGAHYSALMVKGDPKLPDLIDDVAMVDVRPEGYKPRDYGNLYVFRLEPGFEISRDTWGHDGSPIFDDEFNVVALVSAVTVDDAGVKLLATPLQPLLPGIATLLERDAIAPGDFNVRSKCSVSDLVRRINRQVDNHAIWTVEADDDEGEPTGDINISYESAADFPNVKSITVTYDFFGYANSDDQEINFVTRIPPPAGQKEDPEVVTQPHVRKRWNRTFRAKDIVRAGQELYEPAVAAAGGSLVYVRLKIMATFADSETSPKAVERRIYWNTLQ